MFSAYKAKQTIQDWYENHRSDVQLESVIDIYPDYVEDVVRATAIDSDGFYTHIEVVEINGLYFVDVVEKH